MTTVKRFKNCKITVYPDHGVPHFHIDGPDLRAAVEITTLTVLVGDARKATEALEWALDHRDLLMAEWLRLNTKG